MNITQKQIRTKKRVSDHGEVFTSDREVNAMLDLVKQETERIESRFLEPACGNGNFLVEILNRKLKIVKNRYKKSPYEYEKYSLLAVSSIYGVDLLKDNIEECKNRLVKIVQEDFRKIFKTNVETDCLTSIRFILDRNILCGDALTLKGADGDPIIFSEWSFPNHGEANIVRRDFRLDHLLDGHVEEISLFSTEWIYDEEVQGFLPKPIREFSPINFRRLGTDAK